MRITGLEALTPEQVKQLGTCEICGAVATNFTRNVFFEYRFDKPWVDNVSPGELHRRCDEHPHGSRVVDIVEGPVSYLARTLNT